MRIPSSCRFEQVPENHQDDEDTFSSIEPEISCSFWNLTRRKMLPVTIQETTRTAHQAPLVLNAHAEEIQQWLASRKEHS